MDEVHVQMEAGSSCQKLCWRESNVNAWAELTVHEDHVNGTMSAASGPSPR